MEEKKRNFKVYLPIAFSLVFVAGMLVARMISVNLSGGDSKLFSFSPGKDDKLKEVLNYIQDNYVDSLTKDKLTEDAISSLLAKLDPHSAYISAAEFNDANDPLVGSFDGIGVEFHIERDTITVMNVIPGGPSEGVGLMAGDRIVKVDGKNVARIKITNTEVMKKLKGKRGTTVKVSIFRRGVKGLMEFVITRNVIPTYSLDIAYMLTKTVGYIKLSKFSGTTHDEFVAALKKLKAKGLKKLILDLRDNGGGYMQAATDIADEFLSEGKLIVYTKGAHKPKTSIYATDEGLFEQGTLVVLVNETSASASEIVTGAIQDNDRGTVIGRRTFGKGLVQGQVMLFDSSAIRLTIARYYTPTGRCIQKSYKEGTDEYYAQFYEQYMDSELENPDSIKFNDSLKFKTPKGKIVYGGGGIMPDIFVPLGKDENSKYYTHLYTKGLIVQFAFDYTDKNRQALNAKYKNAQGFINGFIIDNAIFDDFTAYAEKNGVAKDEKGIAASEKNIKVNLKALIGRNLFRDEAYYPVLKDVDKTLIKALSVIDTLK